MICIWIRSMTALYCSGKRERERESERHEAHTGMCMYNPLSIDFWAVCWEVSSNQRSAGEEHDRCQQGYMFITHLFIIPQELNTNSPYSFLPWPHLPVTLHLLYALVSLSVSLFLFRTNESKWNVVFSSCLSILLVSSQTAKEKHNKSECKI